MMSEVGFERLRVPGFYIDAHARIYFYMGEFLHAHRLPDLPEVRGTVRDGLLRQFGDLSVWMIEDGR